jgi:hypothetical protein
MAEEITPSYGDNNPELHWFQQGRELIGATSFFLRTSEDEAFRHREMDPEVHEALMKLIIATARRMTSIIESPDLLNSPSPSSRTPASPAESAAPRGDFVV